MLHHYKAKTKWGKAFSVPCQNILKKFLELNILENIFEKKSGYIFEGLEKLAGEGRFGWTAVFWWHWHEYCEVFAG